jgi:hypothetical protein
LRGISWPGREIERRQVNTPRLAAFGQKEMLLPISGKRTTKPRNEESRQTRCGKSQEAGVNFVASDVMPIREKSGWRVFKVIDWLTGVQDD